MCSLRLDIPVPEGWTCWIEIVRTEHGTYAGMAELTFRGMQRGAVVLMRHPTRDAAAERAAVRADHFIRQWDPTRDFSGFGHLQAVRHAPNKKPL
jgi:hypothetical protein